MDHWVSPAWHSLYLPSPFLTKRIIYLTAWGCQADLSETDSWRGCIIDGKLLYLCEDFSMITERSGIYSCQQNSVSFQHEPVRQTPSCSCNWIVRAFYRIHGNPENSSNGWKDSEHISVYWTISFSFVNGVSRSLRFLRNLCHSSSHSTFASWGEMGTKILWEMWNPIFQSGTHHRLRF